MYCKTRPEKLALSALYYFFKLDDKLQLPMLISIAALQVQLIMHLVVAINLIGSAGLAHLITNTISNYNNNYNITN